MQMKRMDFGAQEATYADGMQTVQTVQTVRMVRAQGLDWRDA